MNEKRRLRGIVDTELFDYGAERSRLLVRAWRRLSLGAPIDERWIDESVNTLGMDPGSARDFLGSVSERDDQGRIHGVLGLSLKRHPHDFVLDGRRFYTWCAIDTLFLPAMLGANAIVESESPVSKTAIRIEMTPDGPRSVAPAAAVVSIPVVEAEQVDTSSTEGIWSAFCHRIYFFAAEAEAVGWIRDKGDMEIVSVEAAWHYAMETWSRVLPFAREADAAA